MALSPYSVVKCFRYRVEVVAVGFDRDSGVSDLERDAKKSFYVATSKAQWEGPHLVLSRGIRRDCASLFDEIMAGFENLQSDRLLRVTLWDEQGHEMHDYEWFLAFSGIQNRGFDFLNAAINSYAHESVCFLNARMVEVKK